ncbi:class I SAM-dependent methyltransferase [Novosphingobium sp. 9]|uniref:class I SAM-dependent methyltransferase n=1 Tax=Novosphingobium sp. 9 TaxID=2025349 RepID=UPI0021B5B659|nr:class I SAM-dependent methyltransferase [Novosphingobium sp. 9]
MAQQNAYQVSDWNGRSGQRWVDHQQRLDAMLAPFGEAALAAAWPRKGEHVLDVGCGAGTSTLALAQRVGPAGQVLGVDISAPLIRRARERMPVGSSVTFSICDAGSAGLRHAAFDLLFSRFGVMFFDDPTFAFAHMHRALKPGGRLAFVCWRGARENDWVRLPLDALAGIVPTPPAPPPGYTPGPFAFADRAWIRGMLTQAGYNRIDITPYDFTIPFGQGVSREDALDDALRMASAVGPLSRALADQDAEVRLRASEAVRAAFDKKPGERSVLIDGAAWIVTARA